MKITGITKDRPAIAWWSGGVTSAVACWLAIEMFGIDKVRIVFIDTHNEDDDTYRFLNDCEKWYGKPIEVISRIGVDYNTIQEVWFRYISLNVATGAICSTELKRGCREKFERENMFSYQVFGFEVDEPKRMKGMSKNYRGSRPLFPLALMGYDKKKCIDIIQQAGIAIPAAYNLGLNNNNCLKTGCVQGGIGYWQHMREIKPDVFNKMAQIEHDLTDLKGQPVTMLKDQSKDGGLVFLKPHLKYPFVKDISMMKGRPPKPLLECNGFCGVNDLQKNETELEINYDTTK